MKTLLSLVVLCFISSALQAATIVLPSNLALPPGSSTNRGFIVRTVQAADTNIVANTYTRAIRQLNGNLVDESGVTVTNEAIPGPNADGSYNQQTVNFEKDALSMDVTDASGAVLSQL